MTTSDFDDNEFTASAIGDEGNEGNEYNENNEGNEDNEGNETAFIGNGDEGDERGLGQRPQSEFHVRHWPFSLQ